MNINFEHAYIGRLQGLLPDTWQYLTIDTENLSTITANIVSDSGIRAKLAVGIADIDIQTSDSTTRSFPFIQDAFNFLEEAEGAVAVPVFSFACNFQQAALLDDVDFKEFLQSLDLPNWTLQDITKKIGHQHDIKLHFTYGTTAMVIGLSEAPITQCRVQIYKTDTTLALEYTVEADAAKVSRLISRSEDFFNEWEG